MYRQRGNGLEGTKTGQKEKHEGARSSNKEP